MNDIAHKTDMKSYQCEKNTVKKALSSNLTFLFACLECHYFIYLFFIFYLFNAGNKNIQLKVYRRNSFSIKRICDFEWKWPTSCYIVRKQEFWQQHEYKYINCDYQMLLKPFSFLHSCPFYLFIFFKKSIVLQLGFLP